MSKKILTGSSLKWIALILMMIDHIGVVIIPHLFSNGIGNMYFDWKIIYQVFRSIGRLSFPIYCFLLVEGYKYSSNRWKYFLRLFLLALISEVFFDLAIYNDLFYIEKQNIFFELSLGILLMMLTDFIEQKISNTYICAISVVSCWFLGMLVAYFLKFDYGMYGILSIGIIYLFRNIPVFQVLGGAASFYWELPAPAAFLLFFLYNGERGKQNKYFFYLFYPIHLGLLSLIRWMI